MILNSNSLPEPERCWEGTLSSVAHELAHVEHERWLCKLLPSSSMVGSLGTQPSFSASISTRSIQNPDTAASGEMTSELGNMRNVQANGP